MSLTDSDACGDEVPLAIHDNGAVREALTKLCRYKLVEHPDFAAAGHWHEHGRTARERLAHVHYDT